MNQVNSSTRYFIDIDAKTSTIIDHGFGDRHHLLDENPQNPSHVRIFISRGQFNILDSKLSEFENSPQ